MDKESLVRLESEGFIIRRTLDLMMRRLFLFTGIHVNHLLSEVNDLYPHSPEISWNQNVILVNLPPLTKKDPVMTEQFLRHWFIYGTFILVYPFFWVQWKKQWICDPTLLPFASAVDWLLIMIHMGLMCLKLRNIDSLVFQPSRFRCELLVSGLATRLGIVPIGFIPII